MWLIGPEEDCWPPLDRQGPRSPASWIVVLRKRLVPSAIYTVHCTTITTGIGWRRDLKVGRVSDLNQRLIYKIRLRLFRHVQSCAEYPKVATDCETTDSRHWSTVTAL